jgi:hypothetical protein
MTSPTKITPQRDPDGCLPDRKIIGTSTPPPDSVGGGVCPRCGPVIGVWAWATGLCPTCFSELSEVR